MVVSSVNSVSSIIVLGGSGSLMSSQAHSKYNVFVGVGDQAGGVGEQVSGGDGRVDAEVGRDGDVEIDQSVGVELGQDHTGEHLGHRADPEPRRLADAV